MAKYKATIKDVQLIVQVKLSRKEEVIFPELDYLYSKNFRGFLQPEYKTSLLGTRILYKGPMGISLHERFQRPMNRHDFLLLVAQLVEAIRKVQANNLQVGHLVLDLNQVYMNETTRGAQFIYLPVAGQKEARDPLEFLKTLLYSLKPSEEENNEYLTRFNMMLSQTPYFDGDAINYFISLEDSSIIRLVQKNSASSQPRSQFSNQRKSMDQRKLDDSLYSQGEENTDHLYTESSDTPFSPSYRLNRKENQGDPNFDNFPKDFNQVVPVYEDPFDPEYGFSQQLYEPITKEDYEDGTTLLTATSTHESWAKRKKAKLLRASNNQVIEIDKPVFRIGKESSYVNYWVSDNTAVSRSHADIVIRGDDYYIADLNSKNGSFLNGQRLPSQKEVKLEDGDKIRLANEEFIFLAG